MIKINVTTPQGTHYTASFPATDAGESQAIVWIEARPDHTFGPVEDSDMYLTRRLHELIYPTCHHGMALDMCMDPYGPHHFGTREQEMAREGY